ncbi:tripartite tricarboxylate transporter substrate binding protein [Hydrogenophaga sp.]|uniref:Bug family tripartite tricarboxylate transporter substrate binding protein n=1 Tax=Hydrogenophaga sp. TaxID=1904254 RepID=UPI002720BDB2|nr:tripartite tricarboxylate transporter substrate binding protein [Hydrogenophaga sp.]MDO9437245.1 tripartite tricarboxylate transporter substrate binding protein [Hydrogenophaga sp.]
MSTSAHPAERRRLVIGAALGALTASLHVPVHAQAGSYPVRPIRVVVPFAAGGAGDLVARSLGDPIRVELGQGLVVDNISGGNTIIGTQAVTRAQPDGYTLLQASTTNVLIPSLQANLPFDLYRDLVPVASVGAVPMALAVNANAKYRNVADLVAAAKSTSGGLFYSSGGSGSLTHLAGVRFAQDAKIEATHVPFRGGGPATQAVRADQVQFTFGSTIAVMGMVKSGDLRLLAVTSPKRLANFPDVPTMVEQGFPDFVPMLWYGYMAPAKTPPAIVEKLHGAIAKAVRDPAVQTRFAEQGLAVEVRGPADFGRYMQEESRYWHKVIVDGKVKLE